LVAVITICAPRYEKTMAATQRAAQDAQRKQAAIAAQIVRDEEARGYKHVTVKDLLLDGRTYAQNETKIAVSGFYKAYGSHNERLYGSDSERALAEQTANRTGSIGMISENGSRTLREYLLRCSSYGGCNVTILGHIGQCTETNTFGVATHDVCLVAEDMRPCSTDVGISGWALRGYACAK
jgi:hypothetical protein